jgi:hypothetical protein
MSEKLSFFGSCPYLITFSMYLKRFCIHTAHTKISAITIISKFFFTDRAKYKALHTYCTREQPSTKCLIWVLLLPFVFVRSDKVKNVRCSFQYDPVRSKMNENFISESDILFCLGPKEHSLKVSAQSVKKSGRRP